MAARYKAKVDTPHGPRTCFEARQQRERQAGPGSPIRRDPPGTARPDAVIIDRLPGPPRAPPQGADQPAPHAAVRAVRAPAQRWQSTRSASSPASASRARPARVGGAHGEDAAQDAHRLRTLPRRHPREPCRERGIGHWRATCTERCPRGSEEGSAEKDLPHRRHLAALPILSASCPPPGAPASRTRARPSSSSATPRTRRKASG